MLRAKLSDIPKKVINVFFLPVIHNLLKQSKSDNFSLEKNNGFKYNYLIIEKKYVTTRWYEFPTENVFCKLFLSKLLLKPFITILFEKLSVIPKKKQLLTF